MKKIVLLLLLFTGTVNAQIVDIPDANFKAKLIALGYDTNTDGQIQQTEASNIGMLDVNNSNIADLTGIEHFENLVGLNCSNNAISDLNLTGLSHLQIFDCSNNFISNLNLTGVTNLNWLICSNNLLTTLNGISETVTLLRFDHNRLTSFNATDLVSLLEIDCSYNRLASFSITGSPALASVMCNSNLLTSIDINTLPGLVTIDISDNKLTTLNVANLTELNTINCKANPYLTTVSLNNLGSLQSLSLVGVSDTGNGLFESANLTNLTLTNLPQLSYLNVSNNKIATLNLSDLSNLTFLDCSVNQLTNLSLVNLPNLKELVCYVNKFQSLDVTNLSALMTLRCGGGYRNNNQLINVMQSLNVSGLSNLTTFECFDTLITTLDLTGLTSLENFYFAGIDNAGVLSSLDVSMLTNLKYLTCRTTALTSLDVSNLIHLEELFCWQGHLTNLNLNGLTNLKKLDYSYNYLTDLSLTNLPLLETLNCSNNNLQTLNVSNLTNLKSLSCHNNSLTTLNLNGLASLIDLDFSFNNISLPNISGISSNLRSLVCMSNSLVSLDVSGFPALESLFCKMNNLNTLDLSANNQLKYLNCDMNNLSTLNVNNLTNLTQLECSENNLTALNTSNLSNLTILQCNNNSISALDLTSNPLLEILSYSQNPLPNFNVNNLVHLKGLGCFDTQTSALDVSNLVNLDYLFCGENNLQTLDLSNCVKLNQLSCFDNNLTTLFMKNGRNEAIIDLANNNNLEYICADADQLYSLQTYLNSIGLVNTVSNSYCTFTPGGNHNTIAGTTIYDKDHNGCDVTDEVNPFIRLDIFDGDQTGSTVTNINGSYNYYTNEGTFQISPNVENPTWFDFSPSSATFNFADNDNNISTQDFCIDAIGIHSDVEVVLMPVDFASPGFDATYKIVYKNKGNQMRSGNVTLTFEDSKMDFVSSVPTQNGAFVNQRIWNYVDLMPFENRSIFVKLNINAPTETPAVNIGDILNFTASITPTAGDELPLDNTFSYGQIVIGSFDPNDITCLEGDSVAPSEIGNYLHYAVNFENTGNAAAQNVVVRMEINPAEFDVHSLQVMNASHPVVVEIRNNVAEFKFPNINLQPSAGDPPVGGHGTILFKVKSNDALQAGDLVKNSAGIYFDYNFPIGTGDAETMFAILSTPEFTKDESVKIFPNPATDFVNISCDSTIQSVELLDIQGRLIQTAIDNKQQVRLDLSSQSNGIYFIRITTEKGKRVEKVIKN